MTLDKLKTMASEPKDKHVFHIESYEGLTGLLENIKIFLELELSEVFPKDTSLRKLSTVFSKVSRSTTLNFLLFSLLV